MATTAIVAEANAIGIRLPRRAALRPSSRSRRYAKRAKSRTLIHVTDMKNLQLPRHFDIVWAFSVVIHLTDELLLECFDLASRHLTPSGVLYANVSIGDIVNE